MDRAASWSRSSPADEPLEDPANEERFRALLGTGYRGEAVRVRGRHRRVPRRHAPGGTTGGPRRHRAPGAPARRVGRSHSRRPRRPAALLAPRGTHRIPERYAPTDLLVRARWPAVGRRLGARRRGPGQRPPAPLHGPRRGAGRRRAGRARARRARGARDGVGGLDGTGPLRRRRQEPRHQPLPARGGAARGGRGRRLRRTRPLHGGGGSDPRGLHHRHQGQEHHDGTAPCTC